MKIDYCFHTHTYRCGHARGKDEEYVLAAINAGIKVMGFSDHVFLPRHSQPGTRGNYSELQNYIDSIRKLQEKYKDKIKILLGFECEYFEEYEEYYKSLKKLGFDYLIMGQHFFMNNGFLFYIRNSIEKEDVERYYEYVEKGVKSGLFTYLAHPDLFVTMKSSFDEQCVDISTRICKLCKKYDMPIEINLNGMSWNLPNTLTYACPNFWEIAGKIGNKVVIGYDAHWPEFFAETKYVERALEFVEKYNLNLINKNDILERIRKI